MGSSHQRRDSEGSLGRRSCPTEARVLAPALGEEQGAPRGPGSRHLACWQERRAAAGAAAGRELLPLLKMAAPAGGAHGSLAAQRSGGMAAAAKEPSWVDWDEEEEEEEETVSATAEARAVVAGVEVAVCGAGSRRAASRRLAGLCP